MTTRTINIALVESQPQQRRLIFTPDLASLGGSLLLEFQYETVTADDGTGSIDLPVKDTGAILYHYEIPGYDGLSTGSFALADGADANLDELIVAGGTASDSVKTYIDEQIAAIPGNDPDILTIGEIDSSETGVLATDGGGWILKTYAALKTALGLSKADVGLPNVDNTSDADKPVSTLQAAADAAAIATAEAYAIQRANHTGTQAQSTITNLVSDLAGKQASLGFTPENAANKNQASGYAGLDSGGLVPSALLPSFVDDVLEAANFAALPGTGETGKIYVTLDNNKTYRWSGSAYVEISASPGSTDSVTEGSVNLYFTAARVLATVLTGLSLATGTAITAADTVLAALGKLQKQITDLTTTVSGKVSTSTTVNGHALSANVTVSASDVGLGNVDNTSNSTERAATATLTNKRITKRVATVTQDATPTINTDNADVVSITGLQQAITSMTTNLSGTPVAGDDLIVEITDNGTARAIAWGTKFEASTVALPTTTVISTLLTVAFRWNAATSKWRCVGVA